MEGGTIASLGGHRRGQRGRVERDKSNGRRNSLGADTLKHLSDEARTISLRASFESPQLSMISISSAW